MNNYTQLVHTQRYQIYALLKAGHNQSEIAQLIGVHKSTISRELHRNKGLRGYRPKQAQRFAYFRRVQKVKKLISTNTWTLVQKLINKDWSPEQISGWLKQEKNIAISHERIYQYILHDKSNGGDLFTHLRCQKKRRKRYGKYDRRGQILNRVSIENRPAIVASKKRYGDWEVDTIIGSSHQQAIVSITERKSRLALIRKVKRKTADLVGKAVIDLLNPISQRVYTITADNGKEFAKHQTIAKQLKADFYFAHPYASWERGLNENTNGLIRQYFPKKQNFKTISDDQILLAMEKINNRPRKCLGFKTPNQVFFGLNPDVALTS